MPKPKLHPDSLLTLDDQLALYREQMGLEAAERQHRAARLAQGKCVCDPVSVKRRWMDSDKATTRRVHNPVCPRYKRWMEEALGQVRWKGTSGVRV